MNEQLNIYKKPKKEIIQLLTDEKYIKIDDNYNYLIDLPIYSFTKEKLDQLESNINSIKDLQLQVTGINEHAMLSNAIDAFNLKK